MDSISSEDVGEQYYSANILSVNRSVDFPCEKNMKNREKYRSDVHSGVIIRQHLPGNHIY